MDIYIYMLYGLKDDAHEEDGDGAEDTGTSPVEPVTFESVAELAIQLKSISIDIEYFGDGCGTISQGTTPFNLYL